MRAADGLPTRRPLYVWLSSAWNQPRPEPSRTMTLDVGTNWRKNFHPFK
jgi:hypothetical protein